MSAESEMSFLAVVFAAEIRPGFSPDIPNHLRNGGFSPWDMPSYPLLNRSYEPASPDPNMAAKAFENPLVPNVRMRALYRALVETRFLSALPRKSVPHASRLHRDEWALPRQLEACYVSTAIDLHPGDLTSAPISPALVDHIRATGARPNARAATRPELQRTLNALAATTPTTGFERLLTAIGMAAALKSVTPGKAVVAYAATNELSATEWKRLLQLSLSGTLPLIIVALPAASPNTRLDLYTLGRKLGLTNLPILPVDAGDPLALYRVAQETLVRARADGGTVILECIPCNTDPVAMLASQLLKKSICLPRWIEAAEPSLS
jgi:hypothetical protein